jgi:hypothetical protein
MNYGIMNDDGNVIANFNTPMTFVSNQPVFTSDTLSLQRRTTKRGAQRWELTSNLRPLNATAEELFVNMVTKGHHTKFKIKVPQNIGVIEKDRATHTINNVKETLILSRANVDGHGEVTISAANSVSLTKGTLVTLSDDLKVYMVMENTVKNSINPITVKLYPELRKTTETGVKLRYVGVEMQCYYDTDTVQGMVYQDGILMDNGTVKLIEALQ